MGFSVFDTLHWTSVQWTLYAIIVGITVGFVGNMLANSIIQMWLEESKKTGIPINWKKEINKWFIFFIVILVVFMILLYFGAPTTPPTNN
jgi:Na+/H+ antiporter NhaD/arsenite permease-like protein